jgi:Asp-tRNA(Asn)/Glu-tRNA(Gln) amidotransferase A subunit family amidase
VSAAIAAGALALVRAQTPPPFALEETTIAQIQAAFREGSLTCRSLVEQYIRRIDAYDKNGPALNAIVMINPDALKTADDLDRRYRQSGAVGPMHCVPVIVKDNYETIDMPTTAGSLSLKDMRTGKDAFVVKRLRDAGAVMIAKSNMAEFAFSPVETVNSILPGYTRNPYDTSRVTAGSSGGSAAAAAANLGAIALASDSRRLDSRTCRPPGPGRPPFDDGPGQPRGRRAVESGGRHRRGGDQNGRGHRRRASGDRR